MPWAVAGLDPDVGRQIGPAAGRARGNPGGCAALARKCGTGNVDERARLSRRSAGSVAPTLPIQVLNRQVLNRGLNP